MHTTRKTIYTVVIAAAALVFAAYTPAQQSATKQAEASKKEAPAKAPAAKPAASSAKTGALATSKQKESYALGMNIANGLKRQEVDVDTDALLAGIKDELSGKTQLTNTQAVAELKQLSQEVHAKRTAEKIRIGAKNMKEGEAFLAANKTKPGVVELPSGLQYKIEKAGTGPKPTAKDTVVCNYRGTFIDGREFDSSYKRGKPATFPVTGVIKGWTEALQLMPVGSKWELFIPSDLAYGPSGRGPIGPDATLVFEVELLSIQGNNKK